MNTLSKSGCYLAYFMVISILILSLLSVASAYKNQVKQGHMNNRITTTHKVQS
jgi:hypothetical protein